MPVVETAMFQLAEGADEESFLEADRRVQTEFAYRQASGDVEGIEGDRAAERYCPIEYRFVHLVGDASTWDDCPSFEQRGEVALRCMRIRGCPLPVVPTAGRGCCSGTRDSTHRAYPCARDLRFAPPGTGLRGGSAG